MSRDSTPGTWTSGYSIELIATLDAVWALSRVSYRDSNQLFGAFVKHPVGKNGFREGLKSFSLGRSQGKAGIVQCGDDFRANRHGRLLSLSVILTGPYAPSSPLWGL